MEGPLNETNADQLIGRTIDGRYRIIDRVARGGMAMVYEAVDTRLDRVVALKVMHSSLADDPEFVARFHREARAAARLTHPNVVAVYDQGESDGLIYLAMEFVVGRNLRDVLQEHRTFTPEQALVILEPVLSALEAAHAAGFVHRDIKPENILISDDGRVKVTDFGLARSVDTTTTMATQGVLIGTVAYLSPEQVERGTADERSDIYSAGVVLFEMLTGKVPFTGDTPLSVAYQHVHDDIPAPSVFRPGIPQSVDDLVLIATRRDPNERYTDIPDFMADIKHVRSTLPAPQPLQIGHPTAVLTDAILAAPTRVTQRVPAAPPRARPKRRRRLVITLCLLLLLVGGASVGGWWLATASERNTPVIVDVTVPKIAGMSQQEATSTLSAIGLILSVGAQEFSESVAAGKIISSNPVSGTSVRPQTTVTVVLSKGAERFKVPQLYGLTEEQATKSLEDANLSKGNVSKEFDPVAPIGTVIGADPSWGAQLKAGAAVNLTLSKGHEPVEVPKLAGLSEAEATSMLKDLKFDVATTEEYSDSVTAGNVISSDPHKGAMADYGSTVTLTISKGPEPIVVPDVVDMLQADAVATLEGLGFDVQINAPPVPTLDRVISQNPDGGTPMPPGSTIEITIV